MKSIHFYSILSFLFILNCGNNSGYSTNMAKKSYQYLALGDSYTIGEKVLPQDNFPNQVAKMLTNDTVNFHLERIIATTGWTTDELEAGIIASNDDKPLLPLYDFVSLLIGVNNQNR